MPQSNTFLIALALFSVSSLTTAVCYARVQLDKQIRTEIIHELPGGQSSYVLSNVEGCFGTLNMQTKESVGEITVDGQGLIRTSWEGIVNTFKIELHAEFNALRQLGGSYLRIVSDNSALTLSTLNVRPIKVKVRWLHAGQTREMETTVPGPVSVRKTARGGLTIQGDVHETSSPALQFLSQQPLIKALAVKSVDTDRLPAECPAEPGYALQLDPVIAFLKGIGNSLPMQLP